MALKRILLIVGFSELPLLYPAGSTGCKPHRTDHLIALAAHALAPRCGLRVGIGSLDAKNAGLRALVGPERVAVLNRVKDRLEVQNLVEKLSSNHDLLLIDGVADNLRALFDIKRVADGLAAGADRVGASMRVVFPVLEDARDLEEIEGLLALSAPYDRRPEIVGYYDIGAGRIRERQSELVNEVCQRVSMFPGMPVGVETPIHEWHRLLPSLIDPAPPKEDQELSRLRTWLNLASSSDLLFDFFGMNVVERLDPVASRHLF